MSAARKPLTRREEDTLRRIAAQERMFMRFSEEQRIQIRRLTSAGSFSTSGGSSVCDETIATLAAAALFVLGLDPFADDAFCRLSEVVAGANSDAFSAVTECAGNEGGKTGADWTRRRRDAERAGTMKVAGMEEATP